MPKSTFELISGWLEHDERPILWVGAGMSVPAGAPTTANLLDALHAADDEEHLSHEAAFTQRMQAFVDAYGHGELEGLLDRTFRVEGEPTPAHRAIARLAGRGCFQLIITTNYDRLIERALDDAKVPYVLRILDKHAHLDPGEHVTVLKLHGDRSDWVSTILTQASYDESQARYTRLFAELGTLLTRHRVLFTGCSMQDPRVLDWIDARSDDELKRLSRWRAILRAADWDAAQAHAGPTLTRAKIRPFDIPDFDALSTLWSRLAEVFAPDLTRGQQIELHITPDEQTWTITCPHLDDTRQMPDPLGADGPLLPALGAIRDLIPTWVYEQVPDGVDPRLKASQLALEAQANRMAQAVGQLLTDILLGEAVREHLRAAMLQARPTLLIRVDTRDERADRALALPWELLYLDGGHPVRDFKLDLVRDAAPRRAPDARLGEQLSIGICISAPSGQSALDYEDEEYRLVQTLRAHAHEFTQLGGLDDLRRLVDVHRPTVVHFSGHGLPGALVFEDDVGLSDVRPIEDVVRALRSAAQQAGQPNQLPRLFFLSSCHGASNTQGPQLDGAREAQRDIEVALGNGPSTAATLHREGFTSVIGYFGPVGDALATAGEARFYAALGAGRTVLQAVADARRVLGEPIATRRGGRIRYPLGWAQLAAYHNGEDVPLVQGDACIDERVIGQLERRIEKVNGLPVLQHGFIGRRRTLHEVRRRYRDGETKVFVLQGLGGLGKTALATRLLGQVFIEPGNDAPWKDQLILRVQDAHTVDDLRRQAQEHGKLLALANWDETLQAIAEAHGDDQPAALEATIRALRTARPKLVVYADNMESLQVDLKDPTTDLSEWRSEEGAAFWAALERLGDDGVVLASTRYGWKGLPARQWVKVPPLPPADMLRMLATFPDLRALPWAPRSAIARRADGRPRTLELLDGLVRELDAPPADWIAWFDTLAKEAGGPLTQDLMLDALWLRLGSEACAQAVALTVLGQPAPGDVVDALGAAGRALERASLLTRQPVLLMRDGALGFEDRFDLHSVVKRFLEQHLDDEARVAACRMVGEAYQARREAGEIRFEDDIEGGRQFIAAGDGDRAWPLLHQPVLHLRRLGQYAGALGLIDEAVEAKPTGDRFAQAQALAAQLAGQMGHHRVRAVRLQAASEAAVSQAMRGFVLAEQASLAEDVGQYAEAEGLLRESLAINEQVLGKTHPSYGACLHMLAGILDGQGRYAEAEVLLRESLAIDEQALGKAHPSYGRSLHQLAVVLDGQGRSAEAEGLLREALAIKEQALGKAHPSCGTSLNALSSVLFKQGRYAEAEGLLCDSLTIKEQALGKAHPSYAISLINLAQLVARRNLEEASEMAAVAVSAFEVALGPEHPDTQHAREVLAVLSAAGQGGTSTRTLLSSAHQALKRGDRVDARQLALRVQAEARAEGAEWAVADAIFLGAMASDDADERESELKQALALLEAQGRAEEAAAVRSRLAASSAPQGPRERMDGESAEAWINRLSQRVQSELHANDPAACRATLVALTEAGALEPPAGVLHAATVSAQVLAFMGAFAEARAQLDSVKALAAGLPGAAEQLGPIRAMIAQLEAQ